MQHVCRGSGWACVKFAGGGWPCLGNFLVSVGAGGYSVSTESLPFQLFSRSTLASQKQKHLEHHRIFSHQIAFEAASLKLRVLSCWGLPSGCREDQIWKPFRWKEGESGVLKAVVHPEWEKAPVFHAKIFSESYSSVGGSRWSLWCPKHFSIFRFQLNMFDLWFWVLALISDQVLGWPSSTPKSVNLRGCDCSLVIFRPCSSTEQT